ncbi:MAG: GxxExxY protein [Microscillaceae bacterium]|jgi:GxxExxY protein|nr:GxxExxY protein [Microscillaceae bacterium]
MLTKSYLNKLTYEIINVAIEVHKTLGPGLLENVYHRCMRHEFGLRKHTFESELIVPVDYKGMSLDAELRCDFLFEQCLVIEIKSVEAILPIHQAQLMTYMKLLKVPKGILINFNCINIFKEGQQTFVNELFKSLPD